MAIISFQAVERYLRQPDTPQCYGFHLVVVWRGRTMSGDVIQSLDSGLRESGLDTAVKSLSCARGTRYMVGVVVGASSQDGYAARAAFRGQVSGHSRLTQIDADAVAIVRTARFVAHGLKRVESRQDEMRQFISSHHDSPLVLVALQQLPCHGQRKRPGYAGVGEHNQIMGQLKMVPYLCRQLGKIDPASGYRP